MEQAISCFAAAMSLATKAFLKQCCGVQDVASQREVLQQALHASNSHDDQSALAKGGSTPSVREPHEGPQRRHRRSSMGPDLLNENARRHRRSSLGPGRMEYAGNEPTGRR